MPEFSIPPTSEAIGAQRLLTDMGVASDRLILESGARDTYENAVYLKAELGKLGLLGPARRWVMITSAYHMPRAMASFRQAGFDVEPWPVDYRTRGGADLWRPFDKVSEGLRRVDVATREWVGLFAYWLAGRSELGLPRAEGGGLGLRPCYDARRQSAKLSMSTQSLR